MWIQTLRMMMLGLMIAAPARLALAGGADQAPAPQDSRAAQAAPVQQGKPEQAAPRKPVNPGGVLVFVDPATGKIVQPTDAQMGSAVPPQQSVTRQSPVVMIFGPGGAVGAMAPPESFSYSVAVRAPDGKVVLDCVTGEQAAINRVTGAEKKDTPKREGNEKK